jgi:hypothetical protein
MYVGIKYKPLPDRYIRNESSGISAVIQTKSVVIHFGQFSFSPQFIYALAIRGHISENIRLRISSS